MSLKSDQLEILLSVYLHDLVFYSHTLAISRIIMGPSSIPTSSVRTEMTLCKRTLA